MTLTTDRMGEAFIYLWGSGEATIDWGNGYTQTVTLSAFNFNTEFNSTRYKHIHTFSNGSNRNIVIEGENITYLGNDVPYVTTLDVSKNTALTVLHFSTSDITNLDLSKNTALTYLYCNNDRIFTSSRLTRIDVNKNAPLTHLECRGNQLFATGLNALFGMLHSNAGTKKIGIIGNPGYVTCDQTIATKKGWTFF